MSKDQPVAVDIHVFHIVTTPLPSGDLSPDLKHPFASSTSNPSNVGLALYAVLWAYNGWYVQWPPPWRPASPLLVSLSSRNVLNYFIEEQKNVAR